LRALSVAGARALLAAVALLFFATAAALQPIPPFGARVTDLTGTLTATQTQTLTDQLAALEQRKGSRVAVLIVATTAPEEIEQYSIRITDAWKLSRSDAKTHDGLLLTIAKDDHHVRIDPGRDLEGAITDVAAARIIREYITPKFRAGDFYGGIHDALDALIKLIDGEALPPALASDDGKRQRGSDPLGGLGLGIFALIWARGFFSWLPSAPRSLLVGGATGAAVWIFGGIAAMAIGLGLFGLLVGWLGGSGGSFINRGGWGNGGFGGGSWGGGGWSGGGGGGGFSGGSSGGFSGGGASGSW